MKGNPIRLAATTKGMNMLYLHCPALSFILLIIKVRTVHKVKRDYSRVRLELRVSWVLNAPTP